ncbi:DUF6624 domain-containing protein [Streptomyces changanensis]|uniref:DUF6624 domain-containing protein n=1 Tax=Streptomyces TaxID=1883 RepID=UPI0038B4C9BF
MVGRQAAAAASLLAQHADRHPDLQQECLELLATAGDADPRHEAQLEDRVRIARGQQLIFGTQLTPGPDGTLVLYPVAHPGEAETLRAAWGFEPLKTYMEQVAVGVR